MFQKMFNILCKGWAIPDFAQLDKFISMMKDNGFKVEETQDLSWKITPSAIHSPFVVLKYLTFALFGKAKLKKQNINNLKGSVMGLLIGLHRRKFLYYLIKAIKTNHKN